MIHPDYQYDSSLTGELVRPIVDGRAEVMLGSRIRTRREALAGGMPRYKYVGNRLLTLIENLLLGLNVSEYHTGFRAYKRSVLKKLPFHKYSDDFVFDQQILFGALAAGARIGEIPVPVINKRHQKAKAPQTTKAQDRERANQITRFRKNTRHLRAVKVPARENKPTKSRIRIKYMTAVPLTPPILI